MANIILDGTQLNGVTYLDVPKAGGGTARFSEGGGGGNYQSKTKTFTPSGTSQSSTVTADAGYDALSSVAITVNAAPSGSAKTPATTITANPTISVNSSGLITATVSKTQSVTPTVSTGWVSSGTAGNITVTGSGTEQMTKRDSSDLTASGATVTAPAGYYPSSATKTVASGSVTVSGTISESDALIYQGANTMTFVKYGASITPDVTDPGYISAGTAGSVTLALTTSMDYKAAETFHPSTTSQSVASGQYLNGAQIFNAVTMTNLTAENIKQGVTVKIGDSSDDDCVASVTGTYAGGGGSPVLQNKSVTYTPSGSTQTDSVTADGGYDGLDTVSVTINPVSLENTTVTPTESTQTIQAAGGYNGLGTVTVNPIPSQYIVPTGNKAITSNGSGIDVSSFATVSVNVPSTTGKKTSSSLSSTTTTLSISGLSGEPVMWALQNVVNSGSYFSGASTRYITSCLCDGGSTVYSLCMYKSGSTAREYGYNTCTWSYSSGTITITSPGTGTAGGFRTGSTYRLFYAY